MNGVVHLLWFVQEMPEGQGDVELLIGVYSSEEEAKVAVERVKNERGFADFPQGFEIRPYRLDQDHWIEGFIID